MLRPQRAAQRVGDLYGINPVPIDKKNPSWKLSPPLLPPFQKEQQTPAAKPEHGRRKNKSAARTRADRGGWARPTDPFGPPQTLPDPLRPFWPPSGSFRPLQPPSAPSKPPHPAPSPSAPGPPPWAAPGRHRSAEGGKGKGQSQSLRGDASALADQQGDTKQRGKPPPVLIN